MRNSETPLGEVCCCPSRTVGDPTGAGEPGEEGAGRLAAVPGRCGVAPPHSESRTHALGEEEGRAQSSAGLLAGGSLQAWAAPGQGSHYFVAPGEGLRP